MLECFFFFLHWFLISLTVHWCCGNYHNISTLKPHKCAILWFWRSEVWNGKRKRLDDTDESTKLQAIDFNRVGQIIDYILLKNSDEKTEIAHVEDWNETLISHPSQKKSTKNESKSLMSKLSLENMKRTTRCWYRQLFSGQDSGVWGSNGKSWQKGPHWTEGSCTVERIGNRANEMSWLVTILTAKSDSMCLTL